MCVYEFLHVFIWTTCVSGDYGGQRWALNILEVELQGSCGPPYGPWEANPDHLQEQQMFLIVQPSFEFHKT